MATAVNIGGIGAGSAVFSMGLIRDICLTEGLRGSTVSFMDISQERLDMIHNLATRYADELGVNLTFEKTTDRRKALQDADFVLNTAYVGGRPLVRAQEKVLDRHGYYRPITPGSFHQFKLMLDVTREMEEVCRDAWLIQSASPVFDGCTLMTGDRHQGDRALSRPLRLPRHRRNDRH